MHTLAGTSLRDLYARELVARGYEPDPAQAAAIERLELLRARLLSEPASGPWSRFARRWFGRPGGRGGTRGAYFWGSVGRGKTWLMDLFYDSLPLRQRRRTHFHHFMRDVHATLRMIRQGASPLETVARRLAAQTRVLCLDELYVSDIADAMILGALFQALLARGVVLVITSNVPPEDLYRDGLQRSRFLPAIALLERELDVIAVDGPIDYRLRQLRRAQIYLDSAASDTAARLQTLFDELAGEHGESGKELRIQGRTLRALRRRGAVIWFSFAVLCEGPRGQNDYVDIAQEFQTVFVSDVPIFRTAAQDDAARRFVALVDEFYDQGIKLIVSAAAPPVLLYRAERLQFEFARAVSRLMEMQSEDYLARPHRR